MKPLVALTALVVGLSSSFAFAQSGAEIGMLSCKLTGVENDIVYTEEEFDCTFEPTSGASESYIGQVKEIGLNLKVAKDMTVVWAVLAPTNVRHEPGSLKGTYVGGSADVAVGAGMGAKVLVGGGANSFTLQPISVTGIVGSGASLGVQSFELK